MNHFFSQRNVCASSLYSSMKKIEVFMYVSQCPFHCLNNHGSSYQDGIFTHLNSRMMTMSKGPLKNSLNLQNNYAGGMFFLELQGFGGSVISCNFPLLPTVSLKHIKLILFLKKGWKRGDEEGRKKEKEREKCLFFATAFNLSFFHFPSSYDKS